MSIGDRLEEARKRRGITIREAAEATKIRSDYLNNFEKNNFSFDIPEIYIRGFLRSYAGYLKLNTEKIVTDYSALLIGEGKSSKRENREFFGRLELQQPIIEDTPTDPAENENPKSGTQLPSFVQSAIDYVQTIEKELWIKIGIAATLSLILIISLIWGISAIVSSDGESDLIPDNPAMRAEMVSFTLIAREDLRVEVKQLDPELTLFAGPIPKNGEQSLQAVGLISIICSDNENLGIRIGDQSFRAPTGKASFKIDPLKQLMRQRQAAGN